MKKIALFLDYYNCGGIEKIIKSIEDNLKDDFEFETLTFVNMKNDDNSIKSLLNKDYKSFFLRNLFGIYKLKNYLKNNSFDIIHINCYNAFRMIYAAISKKYVKKVIVHAHNSSADGKFKIIINSLIKKLFKDDSSTFVSCSLEAESFCFNRRSIIIPNGIDYKKYSFNEDKRQIYRKEFGFEDNIVIGNIGRFEKQKNHEFIIKVFNSIIKKDDRYRLVLVGEGILLNQIKKEVEVLNLTGKVIFLNNRNDISDLINMFDIYLMPSLYEGFGLTCAENQINGKIVFASDVISDDVKISNNLYILSLNTSPEDWANKILEAKKENLVLDESLSLENFINKIYELYK